MKARIGRRIIDVPEDRVVGGVAAPGIVTRRLTDTRRPVDRDNREPGRSRVGNPAPPPIFYQFVLREQLPSGKNAVQVTRTGQRYPNVRFVAWRASASRDLKQTTYGLIAKPASVLLAVAYTPGDLIRRDVPGMLDAICHLLEYCRVVEDDVQIKDVRWTEMPLDRKYPHVDVIVRTAGDGVRCIC